VDALQLAKVASASLRVSRRQLLFNSLWGYTLPVGKAGDGQALNVICLECGEGSARLQVSNALRAGGKSIELDCQVEDGAYTLLETDVRRDLLHARCCLIRPEQIVLLRQYMLPFVKCRASRSFVTLVVFNAQHLRE
jgi:hypothetical protein